ncbi:MAG: hydroxyphenylacetyl-CoA thioesterase PaaI [Actinomycetota bacterium]
MGGSQETADAAAAAMFAEDRNAHAMGMIVSAVSPGGATVEMTVLEQMANGLDVCHGGIVFALADTAMAFASNARGGTNLAANASIEWLAPARVGERLEAVATEVHLAGRTGIYDVTVSGPHGVVAVFRGKTKRVADEGPGSP